ncbi:8557_t:CDS:2 [Funneliformis caledonium]|uniref:8557_t:CDS:1 n=1 Tax=Funneliformis caledonium TaxID=1117310 RepID=A0A9N8Z3H6_9GLOM|nr:8557_t:CDS:2 [Funneliformis caledonium]
MKTFMIIAFVLLQTLFASAQELPPTKLDFHTVKVPKYGLWFKCNTMPNQYVSYAIKLASTYAQVDPIDYGGKYKFLTDPQAGNSFYGKYGKGFISRVTNGTAYAIASQCGDTGPNDEFLGVSYSCGKEAPPMPLETWCLNIYNPFSNDQKFDVVLSFTESVFVNAPNRKESSTIVNEVRPINHK